jgi:hypothetical protein
MDQNSRKLLLQGSCKNELYLLPLEAWLFGTPLNKNALTTIKPSMARWRHRLGHASSPIVCRVISQNNLSLTLRKT